VVGVDERQYTVHKDIICNKSPFFDAACKQEWQEGQGIVPLQSIDEDIFRLYIHWVYSGTVDVEAVAPQLSCGHDGVPGHDEKCPLREEDPASEKCQSRFIADLLARLYVAGDALLDTLLQNHTIDMLVEHFRTGAKCLYWDTIEFVWKDTAEDCPLRLCILDHIILNTPQEVFKDVPIHYGIDFLFDMCNRLGLWQHRSLAEVDSTHRRKGEYHLPQKKRKEK
jgi:hypothetical protein